MVAQRINEPGAILPWRQRAAVMVADKAKSGGIIVKPQYLVRAQRQLRLPGRAKDFLEYLDEGTYFKHGIHQQKGTPEHWCVFDLPKWSLGMGMPKPNVHRLRDYLLALHIVHIQVDNDGTVWIGWNLNTDEWLAPPKHGGARAGAGHPKKIQDDNDQSAQKPIQDDNEKFQDDNDQARKSFQDDNVRAAARPVAKGVAEPLRTISKELIRSAPNGATRARSRASPKPKKGLEVVSEDDLRFKIALYFRTKLLTFAPGLKNSIPAATPTGLAPWCEKVRLLLADYPKEDIGRAIDFVFQKSPWWAGKMKNNMNRFHREFPGIYTDMQAAAQKGASSNGKFTSHAKASGAVTLSDEERDAERLRRATAGE